MKKGLLVGAGFSYDLGMPLTHELTEIFLSAFNATKIEILAKLLSSQSPYSPDRPINEKAITAGLNLLLKYKQDKGNNYEVFLADLQSAKGLSASTQSDRDSYNYLFGIFYEFIHTILCQYQQASYEILYPRNKEWFSKLDNLLSEDATWIFTLNHDLYFEYLALDFDVPITYGDDKDITFPLSNLQLDKTIRFGFKERNDLHINHSGFFKNDKGINLVKLHGGLSELEYKDRSILCNLRLDRKSSQELARDFHFSNEMAYYYGGKKIGGGKDRTITNADGTLDIIVKSMLTGGRKYSGTSKIKEGEEKLQIFDDVLLQLDELTIIGYGFGDEHINFRISNALLLNKNLRVVIVNPAINEIPSCIKQFDYDNRIKRALCGAAHWMAYCKSKRWDEAQMKSLKENEKYRGAVKERVKAKLHQFLN